VTVLDEGILERICSGIVGLMCDTKRAGYGSENDREVQLLIEKSVMQVPSTVDFRTQDSIPLPMRHIEERAVAEKHSQMQHARDRILRPFYNAIDVVKIGDISTKVLQGAPLRFEVAEKNLHTSRNCPPFATDR
jgi:hypothetical protein